MKPPKDHVYQCQHGAKPLFIRVLSYWHNITTMKMVGVKSRTLPLWRLFAYWQFYTSMIEATVYRGFAHAGIGSKCAKKKERK